MEHIKLKRAYEATAATDGYRILVDRLWPRGVSKQNAHLNLWAKDIAPSTELRRWFGHKQEHFSEFTDRYTAELQHNSALNGFIDTLSEHQNVTFVYGAHDGAINHAVVLKDFIEHY